jgi:hypothetical protein
MIVDGGDITNDAFISPSRCCPSLSDHVIPSSLLHDNAAASLLQTMSLDLGLNVFQVIQNELLSREGSRSTLGLGFRLAILEERLKNHEAKSKNALIWRPNHSVAPIATLTPEAKRLAEAQRKRLLERRGAKPVDDKDPTMLPRDEEVWEVHPHFPKTVLEFKELQFHRKIPQSFS